MTTPSADATLLPVRMINAHTFCPRLFWLEHVEGLFADNVHTIQGQHVHRRVDKPGGALPAPEAEGPDWHARSLWLSCPELGVSGKLDLVDQREDGAVMPVDTKKGRSREGELWEPDSVQLTLQALLLRSAGYQVNDISAYYNEERRRVTVTLTPEHIEAALQARDAARATAAGVLPPPPLVGSSRCYGCSLNAICLPDETTTLRNVVAADPALEVEVRRTSPPRPETLPLHVTTQGATLRLKKGQLEVVDREGAVLDKVGLGTLQHVCVHGQVHVTGPTLRELLDRGIPLHFFSATGWYRGRTASTANRQVHVRIAQFRAWEAETGLSVARALISDKIHNVRTLLRRNRNDETEADGALLRELRRLRDAAVSAESPASLLGLEGQAARLSWEAFSRIVSREEPAFAMQGRSRRPPRDRTNALLSYTYGMVVRECTHAVEAVGFDPFLGLYHTPHHGRPSLALDLMEPFRPLLADSVVLGVIRRREIQPSDFSEAGQEVSIRPHARKTLLRAFERRMDEMVVHPLFGYALTYRRILHVHARLLARFLEGELPTPPTFRTR